MAEVQVRPLPRGVLSSHLHFGRLQEAEHVRRHWVADIPSGMDLEAATTPSYWAHHTRTLRPNDLIEVVCEDGSWEGLLRVMFVGQTEVKVSVIYKIDHAVSEEGEEFSETHEIVWKGPKLQFAVLHKGTGNVVKDRLYPKSEAFNYLRNHLKALGT